ncbi:hypothetical protein B0H63DRAFT_499125 [Podospora didyma]|uniref:FAD-binding PCMH-type domain-containing protein n=1 Tax=Podospora didyma TaxID=330526 RepID=A0AAE0P830_9PEZI|nr:hypothetical protein B0H63DRAFT_499125 [Podospora didyma]
MDSEPPWNSWYKAALASLALRLAIQPRCKAVPGGPDWPSIESWARLNESTEGRLLRPPPPGAVCHPGQATYNAAECPLVRSAWSIYEFHGADPVSSALNTWNNDSCLPEAADPCRNRGYPVVVINATTSQHVKLGVDFARKYNVRLIVKSTGHDFLGRSVAPNSLSIWAHHLKGMTFHDSKLDPLGQVVVGGQVETISGSSHYGTAADQVLEMEIVTPNGDMVVANECRYRDLFWAMRGGGASTFGIMTSVTIKTFPSPRMNSLDLGITTTNLQNPYIFDMVAYVLSQFLTLGDRGMTGYSTFFSSLPNPLNGGLTTIAGLTMTAALLNSSSLEITTWPGRFEILSIPDAYKPFYDWYILHKDRTVAGTDGLLGSRFLGAEAFRRFAYGGAGAVFMVGGKGVRGARPRGGGHVISPAWRKSSVLAETFLTFPPLKPAARRAALNHLNYNIEALRQLDPDSGAYQNEVHPEEPDWKNQFWGSNYERLAFIKKLVDPEDVLWCIPYVGNELWHQADSQLCRR